jgi:hypothetical protein
MREEVVMFYEYEISSHPANAFRQVIYFCGEDGKCTLEQVPSEQVNMLQSILNERGQKGWELIQVAFGKDGILVFWKRMINDNHGIGITDR